MSTCECKTKIEAELNGRFKSQKPEASDHNVSLQGYGFAVVGNELQMRPFMNYEASAFFPVKKTGIEKGKTVKGMLTFSFCPFCGVKIGGAA